MTRARLVLLGLQLVYLNVVLVAGVGLYELLPRFLNVLLPYFVVPIGLMVLVNQVAVALLKLLDAEPANQDAPVLALGIVAVTAWLGLGLGSYLELFDPVVLALGEQVEDLAPSEAPGHGEAVGVSFSSGVVAPAKVGLARELAKVKSADNYTDVHHGYVVVPLVSSLDADEAVGVWFCHWESGLDERSEAELLDQALALVPEQATPAAPIRALVMRDPALRDHCEQAIEASGVGSHPEALILRPGTEAKLDPEHGRRPLAWFWAIVNLLGLLPAIFVRLD